METEKIEVKGIKNGLLIELIEGEWIHAYRVCPDDAGTS